MKKKKSKGNYCATGQARLALVLLNLASLALIVPR